MRVVWKWLVGALAIAALLYAAGVAVAAIAIPWRPVPFDTVAATTTNLGWNNEARYFLLNKASFRARADRILITGASTARDPFRPGLIQSRLPGWQVANASLSGAPVSEISDQVDLYYTERARGERSRTIWVFAICYMQFRPLHLPPGAENPVATEALRGGLYARVDGRLVPQYSPAVERAMLVAMRPQAVTASLPRRFAHWIAYDAPIPGLSRAVARLRSDDPVQQWIERIRDADLDQVAIPADVRSALMRRRLDEVGGDVPSPASEYARFVGVLNRIRSHGDAAVIVDLPLPEWHMAAVARSDSYHEHMIRAVMRRFDADREIAYLSMRDLGRSDNFFDSAHSKPRMWPLMSARLADWLRSQPLLHH